MSAALVVMGVAILIHAGVRLLDAQIAQQVRAPCDDLRLKLADAANCARQDLLQAEWSRSLTLAARCAPFIAAKWYVICQAVDTRRFDSYALRCMAGDKDLGQTKSKTQMWRFALPVIYGERQVGPAVIWPPSHAVARDAGSKHARFEWV
jgi:hypothetical protein